jgi:hypothetical protein
LAASGRFDLTEVRERCRQSWRTRLSHKGNIPMFLQACGLQVQDYQLDAINGVLCHQRSTWLWGRRTGKSLTAGGLALHCAVHGWDWIDRRMTERTAIIVSRSLPQAQEVMIKTRRMFHRYQKKCPDLAPTIKKDNGTELEFDDGGRVICRPATETSLPGYGGDFVLVDEAARVPSNIIDEIVTPFVATTGGRLVLSSTPWAWGTSFHNAWLNPSIWYQVGPIKSERNTYIEPGFLEDERVHMPPEFYRQEYEAEWVGNVNQVYPPECLQKATSELPFHEHPDHNVAGVDLAKLQDWTVFCGLGADGCTIGLAEYQRLPYPKLVPLFLAFCTKHNIGRALVDQTGVGEPIVEYFRRGLQTKEDWQEYRAALGVEPDAFVKPPHVFVDGYKLTAESKTDLINNHRVMLENGKVTIPQPVSLYQRKLYAQLSVYHYEKSKTPGSTNIRMTAPENLHDDYVIAHALGAWALRNRGGIRLLDGGKSL